MKVLGRTIFVTCFGDIALGRFRDECVHSDVDACAYTEWS